MRTGSKGTACLLTVRDGGHTLESQSEEALPKIARKTAFPNEPTKSFLFNRTYRSGSCRAIQMHSLRDRKTRGKASPESECSPRAALTTFLADFAKRTH